MCIEKNPELDWNTNEAREMALNKVQRELNEYKKSKFKECSSLLAASSGGNHRRAFYRTKQLVNSTMKVYLEK